VVFFFVFLMGEDHLSEGYELKASCS